MKKPYEKPDMEITMFESEDTITFSGAGDDGGEIGDI